MDANQLRPIRAKVEEPVRDIRWTDDDVAWPAFDGLLADLYQDVAFQDDERLVVGVVVQLRPLTWLVMHDEERDGRRPLFRALECARDLVARQVLSVHVVHVFTSCQREFEVRWL